MRKTMAVLAGAAFLIGGAPMTLAKTDQHEFSGSVIRFNSTAKTLAVQESGAKTGKTMSFTLAPDAKIVQGTQAKSLAELKVGERVKVTYSDKGSAHSAQRVELIAAEPVKSHASSIPPRKSR